MRCERGDVKADGGGGGLGREWGGSSCLLCSGKLSGMSLATKNVHQCYGSACGSESATLITECVPISAVF